MMESQQSQLIPILRDGVDVIKMVLFKRLKDHLGPKYAFRGIGYVNQICGAVINELFCVENLAAPFKDFANRNKKTIAAEVALIAKELDDLRIPLTDALRIEFLCDSLEGIDSERMLKRAERCNVLMMDRQVPLPKNFMNLVRKLGEKFNILENVDIPSKDD